MTITNSDLNRPCFAWHPHGKLGLFKTELVIVFSVTYSYPCCRWRVGRHQQALQHHRPIHSGWWRDKTVKPAGDGSTIPWLVASWCCRV